MTTSIHLADATFTKYSRQVLPPYVANCLGYWLFGDTEAKSLKNRLVNPAAPLCTKAGTVTVASNYISVTNPNANGYKSGIVRSGAFTMIAVHDLAQKVSIGHENVGGTGGGAAYEESELIHNPTFWVRLAIDGWTSNRAQLTPAGTGWGFAAATYADPVPTVYQGTGATLNSTVGANYSQSATSTEFRMGATGVNTTAMSLAACLYYDRALSAAELLEVYLWLKGDVLPRRSITLY